MSTWVLITIIALTLVVTGVLLYLFVFDDGEESSEMEVEDEIAELVSLLCLLSTDLILILQRC